MSSCHGRTSHGGITFAVWLSKEVQPAAIRVVNMIFEMTWYSKKRRKKKHVKALKLFLNHIWLLNIVENKCCFLDHFWILNILESIFFPKSCLNILENMIFEIDGKKGGMSKCISHHRPADHHWKVPPVVFCLWEKLWFIQNLAVSFEKTYVRSVDRAVWRVYLKQLRYSKLN